MNPCKLLLLVLIAPPAGATSYSCQVVAVPGSSSVDPAGINNSGTVAGRYTTADNVSHGFIQNTAAGSFLTIDYPLTTINFIDRVAEKSALEDPEHVFTEAPLTVRIVDAMHRVPRVDVPDMPDRLIAATALHFGSAVISRDGRIRSSKAQTVW